MDDGAVEAAHHAHSPIHFAQFHAIQIPNAQDILQEQGAPVHLRVVFFFPAQLFLNNLHGPSSKRSAPGNFGVNTPASDRSLMGRSSKGER